MTQEEMFIISESIWFIDGWLQFGSYPSLDNYCDYIYAIVDGAGVSLTEFDITDSAHLISQRYPDFAAEEDLRTALKLRLADKIMMPSLVPPSDGRTESEAPILFYVGVGIVLLAYMILKKR